MKCQEIIDILQKQAPEHYACDWDNVGLLVGEPEQEIHRVYIALDATEEAIEEATAQQADMLLTHHPMIFKGIKKVNSRDFTGRRVISLIQSNISYYAMHTNFDIKGMARLAAEQLGMKESRVLEVTCEDEQGLQGIGRIGNLNRRMTLEECARFVKEVFAVSQVKVFGNLKNSVELAAVCPGSGKSVIREALGQGAKVLITGDIDHHEGMDAAAQGLSIIDAGHYGIEKIFIPYMESYLKQHAKGIEVISQQEKEPFVYI